MILGAAFGDGIERSIRSSPLLYAGLVGAIVVVVAAIAIARSRRQPRG